MSIRDFPIAIRTVASTAWMQLFHLNVILHVVTFISLVNLFDSAKCTHVSCYTFMFNFLIREGKFVNFLLILLNSDLLCRTVVGFRRLPVTPFVQFVWISVCGIDMCCVSMSSLKQCIWFLPLFTNCQFYLVSLKCITEPKIRYSSTSSLNPVPESVTMDTEIFTGSLTMAVI